MHKDLKGSFPKPNSKTYSLLLQTPKQNSWKAGVEIVFKQGDLANNLFSHYKVV